MGAFEFGEVLGFGDYGYREGAISRCGGIVACAVSVALCSLRSVLARHDAMWG